MQQKAASNRRLEEFDDQRNSARRDSQADQRDAAAEPSGSRNLRRRGFW